jgi:hypothetical protein
VGDGIKRQNAKTQGMLAAAEELNSLAEVMKQSVAELLPLVEWRLVKAQNFLTQSLASWRVG